MAELVSSKHLAGVRFPVPAPSAASSEAEHLALTQGVQISKFWRRTAGGWRNGSRADFKLRCPQDVRVQVPPRPRKSNIGRWGNWQTRRALTPETFLVRGQGDQRKGGSAGTAVALGRRLGFESWGHPECAWLAQLAERHLRTVEAIGSMPVPGSKSP